MAKKDEQLVPFTSRLPKSLRTRLRVHCAKTNVPIQKAVQKAIEEYLNNYKSS